MRIGVVGYFGYGNLGDEMFLRVWRRIFAGRAEVVALQGWERVEQFDRIVIGGGDLILPWFFSSAYWREAVLTKPVYVYGVGVASGEPGADYGPVDQVVAAYRAFLGRCAYVAARDPESAEILASWGIPGVQLVDDLGWTYPVPSIGMTIGGPRPLLGFSLRPQLLFGPDQAIMFASGAIERGFDVLLIPLQPSFMPAARDDQLHETVKRRLLAEELFERGHVNIVPAPFDVDHRIAAIGACALYAGTRMHGLVMALRQGVGILPIATGRKFHRLVDAVGLPHWCAAAPDRLTAMFEEAISTPGLFNGAFGRAGEIAARAERSLAEFADLVLRG